jgi:hypothetical protein
MGEKSGLDRKQEGKVTMVRRNNANIIGQPVEGFPIKFEWQTGSWKDLFDKHVELIQDELRRAQAEDRVIVYLSCPISDRGGGHHRTNVDIANHTARRLMADWGPRFFILNPCQYQMESKEGTGLIRRHAEKLALETGETVDTDALMDQSPPQGGDYMRMWTRVLVEDHYLDHQARRNKSLGGLFSAYYFLAPLDVQDFFSKGGATTLTAGIEDYFARKLAIDPDFRDHFKAPFQNEDGEALTGLVEKQEWERRRKEFFRFYSVRASANFSKGCHDEWNIWVELNRRRLLDQDYGPGEQIAGFFDGVQVNPAASEAPISEGYAVE